MSIPSAFSERLARLGWNTHLENYFKSPDWDKLSVFLATEYETKKVYPEKKNIFRALDLPFGDVRVVIVGQDPYHNPAQANGLAFAVNKDRIIPPGLRNILIELRADMADDIECDGTLLGWQRQGVMLLNTALTVRENEPGSHSNSGWSIFTDQIIKSLSDGNKPKVFILWGVHAQKKKDLIDKYNHCILESAHPSPFSCSKFFGTRPFSEVNKFLIKTGQKPINWKDINDER